MKNSERAISMGCIIPESPDRLWKRRTAREGLLVSSGERAGLIPYPAVPMKPPLDVSKGMGEPRE